MDPTVSPSSCHRESNHPHRLLGPLSTPPAILKLHEKGSERKVLAMLCINKNKDMKKLPKAKFFFVQFYRIMDQLNLQIPSIRAYTVTR